MSIFFQLKCQYALQMLFLSQGKFIFKQKNPKIIILRQFDINVTVILTLISLKYDNLGFNRRQVMDILTKTTLQTYIYSEIIWFYRHFCTIKKPNSFTPSTRSVSSIND